MRPDRLDLAHDEAHLVHVGEDHDRRQPGSPASVHDEVAQTVGAMREAHAVEVRRDGAGDALLVPGEARDAHQLREEVPDHAPGLPGPRVARTRSMKSRARSGSTGAQVSPSTFRAEPTMTPVGHGQDVRHGVVLHARVGQHRASWAGRA